MYQGSLCIPDVDALIKQILEKTHGFGYSIFLGSIKMYCDIYDILVDCLKRDIAKFVDKHPNFQQVKVKHQRP